MIAKLLRFALGQRFLSLSLGLALIAGGLWAFNQLKIEAYPDISDTQAVVISLYPGHAAEEVEQQVTIPIERALNGVPNVNGRRSRTIFGLSVVELTFEDGTDDYFARQLVSEKLRDSILPPNVTSSLGPLTSGIGELYRYRLEGAGNDPMRLRELQDWVVVPRLLQVPGVADVTPFGGLIKQFQIEVDPLALEKYKLTVTQIAAAVSANNQNGGGALLDNQQQSMVVRGVGLIDSMKDIENVAVTAGNGTPVFIRDIGRVTIGAAPPTGIFGVDDKTDGVEGIVLLRRWENPSEVLQGVRDAIDELNETRLPAGVRIATVYDRSDLVHNTLRTVSRTLIEGLIIVIAVLFFFLGSVRAALLAAITIPLSLLFAFLCMRLAGIPANLLSLGAIDFGIIVDGTVVMVEHVVRKLSENPADSSDGILETVQSAALDVERPIFFSLLIIISAYIPLFTLERVERRLFTPMAFTVASALLGSMILALTLVPVLANYLFRGRTRTLRNPLLGVAYRVYRQLLLTTTEHPVVTSFVAIGIVGGALFLGTFLGSEFLPQLDEGVIWIRANLPPGISLNKSAEVATQMRRIIKQYPEVKLVMSQSGRNDSGTDPFGPNRNEFLIDLNPYDSWPHGELKWNLVDNLSRKLHAEIPGATLNFTQPIIDTSTEMATGSSADLAVIISGSDLGTLRQLGNQTLTILQGIPGAVDSAVEQETDQPQLRIRIDRQEAARFAINVSDIQDVIELAIGGRAVSTLFEGERSFDITVRYESKARAEAAAIGNILIAARDGGKVPLSQLAEIRVVNGATIIARRENRRQITVRTNIRGRDQGGFVREAQRKFSSMIQLPMGYQVNWGGQFENLDRARRRLSLILPLTVVLIFGLLYMAFGSVANAGLVLASVPFSLVGGIVALYVRQINLSVSAAVGFISLFGVAVMSGVLLVSEISRRLREAGTTLEDAVVQGALTEMRPILMMIIVAMLGMTPAALATGIGSDVQRPLATVVVGGLLSTLLLTLIALPNMYLIAARHRRTGRPS